MHVNKRIFVLSTNAVRNVHFSVNVACVCLLWCGYSKRFTFTKEIMFYHAFVCLFATQLKADSCIFMKILQKMYR